MTRGHSHSTSVLGWGCTKGGGGTVANRWAPLRWAGTPEPATGSLQVHRLNMDGPPNCFWEMLKIQIFMWNLSRFPCWLTLLSLTVKAVCDLPVGYQFKVPGVVFWRSALELTSLPGLPSLVCPLLAGLSRGLISEVFNTSVFLSVK